MVTQHLALNCRDGFFFKDGRGWATSTMNRAGSYDWPFPPTVLGLVRGAVGRTLETEQRRVFRKADWVRETERVTLGATLPLRRPRGAAAWSSAHRMWPVPADALYLEGQGTVHRLEPASLPGVGTLGRGDDPALEALHWAHVGANAKPLTPPRWWSDGDFLAWLRGEDVALDSTATKVEGPSQPRRTDVRLAVAPDTFTAMESMLYSIEVIEPWERDAQGDAHQWTIGAEVSLPETAAHVPLAEQLYVFGGNGRGGDADALAPEVFSAHAGGIGDSKRLKLYAVTPAHFTRGWLPDGFVSDGGVYRGELPKIAGEVILRGAMVPRAAHWSGWNMDKGGPRTTKRLVPAGAVYAFERADGRAFTATERNDLWLASWGQDTDLGFGRVVAGISKG